MQLRINRTLHLLAILLLGWPAAAQAADIPNGTIVFNLSGPNQIFDFGSWSDCETEDFAGFLIELCLSIDMVPDGKGKYTGTASLVFSGFISGTLMGPASASAKGKADGGSGKLKFAAQGFLSGFETKIKVGCSGPITPGGLLTSLCKVKVTLVGEGSASVVARYDAQLGGGAWTITLNVTPLDEKKFAGTGSDSLGYDYLVSGKFNAKTGMSSLKAQGDKNTASKGAKFQLKNLTDTGIAEAKFKIQGYKGATAVATD